MNNFRKTLLTLGVVGLGSVIAAPAFAQQAYISGSSAITLMNGAAQSVGAEISHASGVNFNAALVVTPTYNSAPNTNTWRTDSLQVAAGTGVGVAAPAGSSFTSAAARKLLDATTLDAEVSIIRAGAGVDGLD